MASIPTDRSYQGYLSDDYSCANNVRVRHKEVEDANMKELPNDELGILVRSVKDGVAPLVKDNPTLRGEVYQALDSLARAATTNLALREPITQSLKSFDNSLSAQKPVVQASIDRCRFCDARAVVERYDKRNFGNEHICASCDELVATKSKDQLVERVVQAYFNGHPHYPENEGTRNLVREAIVEPDHKEFWRRTEQNGRLNQATTPSDRAHASLQQDSSPIRSPQKRLLAPVTCIHERRTALLVEDDKGVTKMLKEKFEREGCLVRSACDADNGFRLYESSGPFVLVMVDFSLPNSGGIELARAIRQNDPSQMMVMTAFAYETEKEVERPPELMDMRILTDVCQLPSLFDSLRPWANKDEVERAIDRLSQADLCRIRKVAERKGWRDWEDLLNETLLRALTGADSAHNGKRKHIRRWDKTIDFVAFLIGSMQGINYHLKKKPENDEHLKQEAENLESHHLNYEAVIAERFSDDPEATSVLQDLLSCMSDDEIKSKRSLSDKQLAAIMTRIRSKLSDGNGNGKGKEHDR
jgi:CheY-like chemotaxis protein